MRVDKPNDTEKEELYTKEGFKNPYYGMNRAQRRAIRFKPSFVKERTEIDTWQRKHKRPKKK